MTERTRGYLPHLELPSSTYFITFRLANTLPKIFLDEIRRERQALLKTAREQQVQFSAQQEKRLKYLESRKIQEYLDYGKGECWLGQEKIAEVVKQALLYFDGARYTSHIFCVMPNHLHWLVTPKSSGNLTSNSYLISILHSIKSFTAHKANKILNRQGSFWSREYYDHLVRTSEEFGRLLVYILENPVKAGLVKDWRHWRWTVCSSAIEMSLKEQQGET